VAELAAYLHSANDTRDSLASNEQKETECTEELESIELNIERATEKVSSLEGNIIRYHVYTIV
jgi:hypothetical protein